jgi:hypothetical protein
MFQESTRPLMRLSVAIFLLLAACPTLSGAGQPNVLKALKAVPAEDLKRLARIEGHEGTPIPEQWHVLVYEPDSETGMKEHVVVNGELLTSRDVSQFTETLTEADIIGLGPLKIDSDKLAKLARDYAEANNQTAATISYQFGKHGTDVDPAWRINCMDEGGTLLGTLVVTPQKGRVVSHEGFVNAPGKKKKKLTSTKLKLEPQAAPEVAANDTFPDPEAADDVQSGEDEVAPIASSRNASADNQSRRTGSKRATRSSRSRRADPISAARTVTRPVRQIVRRILPF